MLNAMSLSALIPPTLAVLYRIHVEEQALLGASARNVHSTGRRSVFPLSV
jgi:hypothetical protein